MQVESVEENVNILNIEFESDYDFHNVLTGLESKGIALQYLPGRKFVNGFLSKSGKEYILSLYTNSRKRLLDDEITELQYTPLSKKKLLEIEEFLNDQI